MPVDPATFAEALRQYAAGVCLLTVRDDIDDVVRPLSAHAAHPGRCGRLTAMPVDPAEFAAALRSHAAGVALLTVLAAGQAILASRFSSAGRPSARHLLEAVPWHRAPVSGAIVLDGGLAALDCRLDRVVEAGDHVLALLEVVAVPVLSGAGDPLLRFRGRYVDGPA